MPAIRSTASATKCGREELVGLRTPAYLSRRFRLLLLDSKWVRTYDVATYSRCGLL